MNKLQQNQAEFENAVRELRVMISHVSEMTLRIRELFSRIRELTSETEVIETTVFSIPDSNSLMPGQAAVRDNETDASRNEPKQSSPANL